jgi:hypothetical protein
MLNLSLSSFHAPLPRDIFPLLEPRSVRDTKDPCPVFDGERWHLFGSAGSVIGEEWLIFHATAPTLHGPWREERPIRLPIDGSGVAAPGVVFEGGTFFMFVQTEFMKPHGVVEFLTSGDGFHWTHVDTALRCRPGTEEDGIYDPHPAIIGGERFLVYSAMPRGFPPKPDIFLAKSKTASWHGPWQRLGKILDHADIEHHHNPRNHPDYEWGIEGAQLLELPDGRVLLNATCFLPHGSRGERQRVFLAVADDPVGPYRSIGPVIDPPESGENGHSTVLLHGSDIVICYQSRLKSTSHSWRYGLTVRELSALHAGPRLTGG